MLINLEKFLISDDNVFDFDETFAITDEDILKEYRLDKHVKLKGNFYKVDKTVLFNGKLLFTYLEACARCLKEFDNKVTSDFNAILVEVFNPEYSGEEIELLVRDNVVDLSDQIKQAIYLNMPMKALCGDDCKGLCSNCGVNLNTDKCECNDFVIDPRLEKLKNLL